ncbi:MAG TPA: MoxR family ATPase [Polyangia bacterium]
MQGQEPTAYQIPGTGAPATPAITAVASLRDGVIAEMRKAIVGLDEAQELMLIGLLAGGHVLLEGVPGTAKTLLCRSLAMSLRASFHRVQFTADLMPSDIIGTNVYQMQSGTFVLSRGPIFTDFLLADEINRAPAKTQSALLEAMQEHVVSIDGKEHGLSPCFTVFATQNPIESEGTYPLPEAQLDRFIVKVVLPYPSPEEEDGILTRIHQGFDPNDLALAGLKEVADLDAIMRARKALAEVHVDAKVVTYVRKLVSATRGSASIRVGAGPRASVHLLVASKARAALDGHPFVTPDHVRSLVLPVLRHRILLDPEVELDGGTPEEVLQEIVGRVEVPR